MNAMVTNILTWEKELEVQNQGHEQLYYQSEGDLAYESWPRKASRWSFMAYLFRNGAARRQASRSC